MPHNPKQYQEQAHHLLRSFVVARDGYIQQMNSDDTTHPVRDLDYERQWAALRELIAEALHQRDR